MTSPSIEAGRLRDPAWRRFGPYLAERQWGTVREDYSADGDAWAATPHDHARSIAWRWSEDGLAGFSDDKQRWCLGIALWNERDPILKERLFGLTNAEGNHGEDVKEVYHYLDGVPSHAWMRMRYLYPQTEYPYAKLVEENRKRGLERPEYEIWDTGVFEEGRYFEIDVAYAKASPDDVLMRVTARNCGPEAAPLHVLAQLWARNTWSWAPGRARPVARQAGPRRVEAAHPQFPAMRFEAGQPALWLFTENETNVQRLYGSAVRGHFKDAFHARIVDGDAEATNPAGEGSRCAAHARLTVAPGASAVLRFRFRPPEEAAADGFADFDAVMAAREAEAEAWWGEFQRNVRGADARRVQRQALAGMLWSKQLYRFDVRRWLDGDPGQPAPPAAHATHRNQEWRHVDASEVMAMPDTWEYPWFAAWDHAFHAVTFALIDPEFAKEQLLLLTREWYMHPNGQLPAYEWSFGDVNPPVHAWAALRVYRLEMERTGRCDREFLARVFHKLMLNFTWWVNRKDADGRNIFSGGFLGLDNIGVFDRSKPLPGGGTIGQSDGTAWMAMYALNLMRIALELGITDCVYDDVASKFFEHFLLIAEAMADRDMTGMGLWDEADGFYYDVLERPDGSREVLRLRSLVGLIPMLAVEVLRDGVEGRHPGFAERARWIMVHRPELAAQVSHWEEPGQDGSSLLSLLRGHRLKALLHRMLDESEFLSPHGIRSLSRVYRDHPFMIRLENMDYAVRYVPGVGDTRIFGGNSNWRGPLWMPMNVLLIESLRSAHEYYGDDFVVEYPTGSGTFASLEAIADALSDRVISLFLPGPDGRAPFEGSAPRLGTRGALLFHEYFDGDTGEGLGASHQTGWTGLVALLIARRAGVARGMGSM